MKDPKTVWQTSECPTWCSTKHNDMDGVDARECVSDQRVIGLTTEETIITSYDPPRAALEEVHVALEQGYREAAPRVTVYRGNGIGFGLTLDEAADLRDALQDLMSEAGR